MNKFIEAIKRMDFESVKEILKRSCLAELDGKNGKNALHFYARLM
jgi:hypothetical protein